MLWRGPPRCVRRTPPARPTREPNASPLLGVGFCRAYSIEPIAPGGGRLDRSPSATAAYPAPRRRAVRRSAPTRLGGHGTRPGDASAAPRRAHHPISTSPTRSTCSNSSRSSTGRAGRWWPCFTTSQPGRPLRGDEGRRRRRPGDPGRGRHRADRRGGLRRGGARRRRPGDRYPDASCPVGGAGAAAPGPRFVGPPATGCPTTPRRPGGVGSGSEKVRPWVCRALRASAPDTFRGAGRPASTLDVVVGSEKGSRCESGTAPQR